MIELTSFIRSFSINFPPVVGTDIAGYVIHACPASELINGDLIPSETNLINKGPDTGFFYTIPETKPAGMWYVKVAAYDTFGLDELNYSDLFNINVASLDPLDQVPPPVPVLNLVTGIETSELGENIFIKATYGISEVPFDFSNYILAYRRTDNTAGPWNEVYTKETSYQINNLIPGVSYDVKVRASDQWNNASEWGGTKTILAHKDTIPPNAPTNLTAVNGFGSVILFWNNASDYDLAGVNIYRSTTNNSSTATNIATVTGTTFTDAGLVTTTPYYYWLKSIDTSGNESTEYSAGVSGSPVQLMSSDLDISARVDFVIRDSIFLFDHVDAPGTASTTLRWTNGSITRGDVTFSLASGSLSSAQNAYVVAACDETTGIVTLSTLPFSGSIENLGADQVVIGFTSSQPLAETNNYVCYIRQSNSIALEGAIIRDATIHNAKILSLGVEKLLAGQIQTTEFIGVNNNQIKIGNLGSTQGILVRNSTNTADVFKVDSAGTASLKNLLVDGLITVGDSKINLDGLNSRITVANNSGTITDMVAVGKLSTGNYGISVKDKDGLQVFKVDEDGATIQNLTAGIIDAEKVTLNNLVVGKNVTMGPTAYISWSNVTNQPTIPTNTTQLTDGAGLGTKATWTGVTGTGKPSDNANNTYVDSTGKIQGVSSGANTVVSNPTAYSQTTAPSSPKLGDTWFNSATTFGNGYVPNTGYTYNGSSWVMTTPKGTYIDGSGIYTGTLIANQVNTSGFVAQTANIADAAITNAKIASLDVGKLYAGTAKIAAALIGDAQVGTLQIAGNAVTVPVVGIGGRYPGNGDWQQVCGVTVTLAQAGTIQAFAAIAQAFTNNSHTWYYSLTVAGQSTWPVGGTWVGDSSVILSKTVAVSAGTHSVSLTFYGDNSSIVCVDSTVTVLGVMR